MQKITLCLGIIFGGLRLAALVIYLLTVFGEAGMHAECAKAMLGSLRSGMCGILFVSGSLFCATQDDSFCRLRHASPL